MVLGNKFGLMEHNILETGKTTGLTVRVNLFMSTEIYMKVNGLKTRCMEMVIFVGKTGSNTAVSLKTISVKVKGHLHGEMVVFIKVSGVTESSTAREFL